MLIILFVPLTEMGVGILQLSLVQSISVFTVDNVPYDIAFLHLKVHKCISTQMIQGNVFPSL